MRLSKKEYWGAVYRAEEHTLFDSTANSSEDHNDSRFKRRAVRTIKGLLGKKVLEYMLDYPSYLRWEVIFKQHLPAMNGAKVLEIGIAPGMFLVKFAERYDCTPYGVEYSEAGARLNRRVFRHHGLDPNNVIHADFFSNEFHRGYSGAFDVVISRGFVEHFSDAGSVIEKHLDLLAPGGYLIVGIPNFRGINYILVYFFCEEIIPLHNLEIMRAEVFRELFHEGGCRKFGVFVKECG